MKSGRPTILQIIPNLDTGGAERTVVDIAAALVNAGARALVATDGGQLIAEVEAEGGEVLPFPAATKNPFLLRANARALKQIIEREDVDLIHARSRAPAWSALWTARRTKIPFVTTYHGAYNQSNPIKGYYNSVMARGDIVIANSGYTADLIRQRHKTPEDKIRVIYRGIDLDGFNMANISEERTRTLRQAWDVAADARVIVQAARLTRWKGQLVTLAAFAQYLEQHSQHAKQYILVFAGDEQGRADYLAELKSSAASFGISDRVRFPGHCADIAAAYGLADLAIVASIEAEAFGRTAAESQAVGTPTIATRLGAPQETVMATPEYAENETTGWLVEPGDSTGLARAIASALAQNGPDRAALAKRARRNVETRFSLTQMQQQTLAVYDALLSTKLAQNLESR